MFVCRKGSRDEMDGSGVWCGGEDVGCCNKVCCYIERIFLRGNLKRDFIIVGYYLGIREI